MSASYLPAASREIWRCESTTPLGTMRLGVGGMGKVSEVPVLGGLKADKGRRGMSLPLRRGVIVMVENKSTIQLSRLYQMYRMSIVMYYPPLIVGPMVFVRMPTSSAASSPTISAPVFSSLSCRLARVGTRPALDSPLGLDRRFLQQKSRQRPAVHVHVPLSDLVPIRHQNPPVCQSCALV